MNVLVLGPDAARCGPLGDTLAGRGHRLEARPQAEALDLVRTRRVDAVLLDMGLEADLLDRLRELAPGLPVIALGQEDRALAAAQVAARGAFGYVALDGGVLDQPTSEAIAALIDRAAARMRVEASRRASLEESLRTSKFYAEVLTSVGQGIVVVDRDGKLRFMNPEAARIVGESEGGLSGQAAVPLLQMLVETLAAERPQTQMLGLESEEEEKTFLYVTTSLLRSAEGVVTGAIAIVSDRSAEKRLEEQLVHTERLATLGSLLASIAHEITNTLTSITGCAEMGLEVAESAEEEATVAEADPSKAPEAFRRLSGEIREIFDMVLQAGLSAQTIANNMLQYSRQGGPSSGVKREDLNDLLRRTLKMLGKHVGIDKVELALELCDAAPWVRVEPSKLQQAMVNLIVNAVHALQEVEPERRSLRLVTEVADGQVCLHVRDRGPGISPRKLERIWKPFFTTKGHGTGLGLYITRKVVEDQGGSIECQSVVGEGTTFTIALPLD